MSQTNGQPTNADILREIRNVYGEIRSLKEGQLDFKADVKALDARLTNTQAEAQRAFNLVDDQLPKLRRAIDKLANK